MRLSDIAHQDYVTIAYNLDDIRHAHAEDQMAIVLCLEAATPIENEVDRLDILYGLGVRQMGIAYSEANTLGSGLKEPGDGGLTVFGRRAVERMNKLGIAIDVSHSGDRTCLDTFEVSGNPVLITHAGARGVWPTAAGAVRLRDCAGLRPILWDDLAPPQVAARGRTRWIGTPRNLCLLLDRARCTRSSGRPTVHRSGCSAELGQPSPERHGPAPATGWPST